MVLDFLLREGTARQRMESLALSFAQTRPASRLAERLSEFVHEVSDQRESLESKLRARRTEGKGVRQRFRHELEAAAASLELFRLPRDVFEKLEGL